MITSSKLRELGYCSAQCGMIMQKLKKIGVPFKVVQIRGTYIKRGKVCDYMHYADSFKRDEVIDALITYTATKRINTNMETWKDVLNKIKGMGC